MRLLIGIDDTDNLESRGTGFRARQLGSRLAERGLVRLRGVTRHQLYVHPSIPYTSHNSALCLDTDWLGDDPDELSRFCRDFLRLESAPGSDAAFCITPFDVVPEDVIAFGQAAKSTVLTRGDAQDLAARNGFTLEGVTGDHGGMIGSVACVGLRKSGHDGRFVWLEGVRELNGIATVQSLLETTGIDVIRVSSGDEVKTPAAIDASHRVHVEPWPRPVLLDNQAVLLVEKEETGNGNCDWKLVPREIIRQF